MGLGERIAFCKQVEKLRWRPLIVYVKSQRPNATGLMAGDVISDFINQPENFPQDTNAAVEGVVI